MKDKYFIKTRLRGIWLLLTRKYVVVLGATETGDLKCHFNVRYTSFKLMVDKISPAFEREDDKMENLEIAKKNVDDL